MRVDEYLVRGSVRAAIVSGVILAIVTGLTHRIVFVSYRATPPSLLLQLWFLLGAFALASVSVFVLFRYRLLSPLLLVVGSYGYTALHSYARLVDAYQESAALSATPTLFDLYLLAWILVLPGVLIAGGGEYALHRLVTRSSQPESEA